jgi:hypothetical protein
MCSILSTGFVKNGLTARIGGIAEKIFINGENSPPNPLLKKEGE